MAAPSSEEPTTQPTNPPARSRRRVNRVNYAEDNSIDDFSQTSVLKEPVPKRSKQQPETKPSNSSSSVPSEKSASLSTSQPLSNTSLNTTTNTKSTSKGSSIKPNKSATATSSSQIVSSALPKREREKEFNDNELIPFNWQPPQETADVFGNILDLENAYVGDDSCLHLADGKVYSPEGMRLFCLL